MHNQGDVSPHCCMIFIFYCNAVVNHVALDRMTRIQEEKG